MLWTIVIVLAILWLLGFALNVVGGIIHILLVAIVVLVLLNVIRGRRPIS